MIYDLFKAIYELFQVIMNDIGDIMNDKKGHNILYDMEQLTCYVMFTFDM